MVKKKEVPKEKTRNVAIELWRFLIALAIIGFHTGWIIARSCDGSLGYYMETTNWFFGSSEVLLVFTLTAGYFMVSHFKRRMQEKEYATRSAGSRAWEYTWSRIKGLMPVLILGYILGVIISTKFFYPDYNFQQVCTMLINSVWEFLGFHSVGLRSLGNEFFNLNGTLWFISAIIIVGYFLYWALCKNEDVTSGFVAPFLFIFLSGWWSFTDTRAAQTAWSTFGLQTTSTNGMGGSATSQTAVIGFNNGLLFVLLGMLGGVLLYYLIEKIKNHKFSNTGKVTLTILNVIASILLLWYTIYPATWFNLERWTVSLLCIIVIGLTLLNTDGLTKVLNNKVTNSLFKYLGSISLYIYMLHYPVAILVLRLLGQNSAETIYSFWLIFIPTVIITIVLSGVTKALMDATILKKKAK
ncbi:MAG: acyltransferase family protein [Bacilli bacterium]